MLLKSIRISGLLSFRDVELEMRPLNVLVGPNASGKSNFIEIMALLQALPRDLVSFLGSNSGISEWFWKGHKLDYETSALIATFGHPSGSVELRYSIGLSQWGLQPFVEFERMEFADSIGRMDTPPFRVIDLNRGIGNLAVWNWNTAGMAATPYENYWFQPIGLGELKLTQSVFSQRRDPSFYPEMTYVGEHLNVIHLYREWNMGRRSAIRMPQPTDAPTDYLYEDLSNLALVLNRLQGETAFSILEEQLGHFYETFERIGVNIYANTAQLWIREKGIANPVSATRLSDGTLRFLALLTVLCHPNPPPLICIEEPELGLHPDVIHQVAKLLIEASKRTQLIVTTHSSELIDHLWEDPESVVVCERYPDTGTEFNRLKKDELKDWLERYELGELWRTGQIGGNRF